MNGRPLTKLAKMAWFSLAYDLFVILWGTFVRASKSGAGCGAHWPLCKGHILPDLADATTRVELTHRVTSGLSLVLTIGLAVAAFRASKPGEPLRKAAGAMSFFMITEALVGAGLVLLEYVADDPSAGRAVWMGVHLINTFLLVASATAFAHFASGGEPLSVARQRGVAKTLAVGLGTVLLIALTGSQAALADTLFPAQSLLHGLAQDLTPGGHFLLRLRAVHPFVAMLGATIVIGCAVAAQSLRSSRKTAIYASATCAAVVVQIGLGFTNVALLTPIPVQIAHLFVANVIWISLVLLALESLTDRAYEARQRELAELDTPAE